MTLTTIDFAAPSGPTWDEVRAAYCGEGVIIEHDAGVSHGILFDWATDNAGAAVFVLYHSHHPTHQGLGTEFIGCDTVDALTVTDGLWTDEARRALADALARHAGGR